MQLKCFCQIRPIFAVAKARATLWVAVLCSTALCTLPPAKVPEYIFVPSSFLKKSEVREKTFISAAHPRWRHCIG